MIFPHLIRPNYLYRHLISATVPKVNMIIFRHIFSICIVPKDSMVIFTDIWYSFLFQKITCLSLGAFNTTLVFLKMSMVKSIQNYIEFQVPKLISSTKICTCANCMQTLIGIFEYLCKLSESSQQSQAVVSTQPRLHTSITTVMTHTCLSYWPHNFWPDISKTKPSSNLCFIYNIPLIKVSIQFKA